MQSSSPRRSTASASSTGPGPSDEAAVRIVYNAVRTLVPETGALRLRDLLAVTRLAPESAAAAMRRLAREGPFLVHRLAGDELTWFVQRVDRGVDRREATERSSGERAVERRETDGRASGERQRAVSRTAERSEAASWSSGTAARPKRAASGPTRPEGESPDERAGRRSRPASRVAGRDEVDI